MPNLTEKYISSLKPRDGRKQYDECDSKIAGFGICYSNGGARTLFVFWRDGGGANRRASIGRHDQGISVSEARRRARAKLAEIDAQKRLGLIGLPSGKLQRWRTLLSGISSTRLAMSPIPH